MASARPLDAFPLIRTSSILELEASLGRVYVKPNMELVGRARTIRAIQNHVQLRNIGLNYGTYGISARWQFPASDFFAQVFPIRANAEFQIDGVSVANNPSGSVMIPPRTGFKVATNADYERLTMTINPAALINKLNAILGQSADAQLKMHSGQRSRARPAQSLRGHVMFLVEQLSSLSSLPPLVLAEFEQTLMVMFLYIHSHNYTNLLEQRPLDVGLGPVRHAEEWIEANWSHPLILETVAASTNVGTYHLFSKFRRARGYSLFEFLKQMRLCHARRMLRHPEASTTIKRVAASCGFADHNQFCRDYAAAFGEHPAEALGRSMGAAPTLH
jgi:AraC-like DNA-binding protein